MRENGPANAPFLKIILPVATGIVLAQCLDIPVWAGMVCTGITFLTAAALRQKSPGHLYTWLSILFFFFTVSKINAPHSRLPLGGRIIATAQVRELPHTAGRWQATTADIGYYRPADSNGGTEGDMPRDTALRNWTRVNERVTLMVDTCYRGINPGHQIAFRGWANPVDTAGSGYGNLMRLRGLHGRIYLTPGNLLYRSPHVSQTPVHYAAVMQAAAVRKLARLDMAPDDLAVATAMVTGDKRSISRTLNSSYSLTGAAHLLAVSGQNIGFVFILVNLLLYLLPVVGRGHIIKNAAVIIAIWLYAFMTGLTPSIIRAALMFSFAQLALATTSHRNALNIMLGSAVLMLAFNPNYAADPSFMLSYTAVLSILLFFNPLFRLVRTRYKALNVLLSVIIVGLTATLGTAPLICYWFGNFPIVGLIINPVIIFTAQIIVMAGVLWVIMPFGWPQPVFSWVLSQAASFQNRVVEWSASFPWGSAGVKLPFWGVAAAYALLIAVAVIVHGREGRKEKSLSLPL